MTTPLTDGQRFPEGSVTDPAYCIICHLDRAPDESVVFRDVALITFRANCKCCDARTQPSELHLGRRRLWQEGKIVHKCESALERGIRVAKVAEFLSTDLSLADACEQRFRGPV